jgi:hypothetical protein
MLEDPAVDVATVDAAKALAEPAILEVHHLDVASNQLCPLI